jgi:signal transduction histidine kinase
MNHSFLTNIEQTIKKNSDVGKLLTEICKIISISGNYSWCWMGTLNNQTGCIEPLQQCGIKPGYLKKISFSVSQRMFEHQSPSGSLFNIAKFYVNNDIWNDPVWNDSKLRNWREKAFPPEFNSMAIFPLVQNLKTIGAVYLYSDKKDFFNHDELLLLEILSMNLSFALDKIELERVEQDSNPFYADKKLDNEKQDKNLVVTYEKAEKIDRLKSAILASIGQKVRTPLNSIIGFVDLLEKKDNTFEERESYCQLIASQSKYLLKVINDVLQVSNIDSHVVTLQKGTVSLNMFLNEINSIYTRKLESKNKKNVVLICNESPFKHDTFTTDVFKFRQIFTTLLDHAIRFTDVGELRFGYHYHEKNLLTCFVSYPSIELNLEDKNDIFNIFRQPAGNSKSYDLAICKSYAHLLGGDIWLKTEPKTGSTIYFTLKYSLSEINSSGILNNLLIEKHWRTSEILLVEDDLCTIDYLTKILTQAGLRLFVAHDGKEAESFLQLLPQIDLVLLDVSLPDISGLDLVKQMKIIRKDIPIIAQTALAVNDDGKELQDAGCDAYITKPYKRNQVLDVINAFMTT